MGKIKGGKISGAVGDFVFAGDIVRSRPKKINTWSEAQKQQRGKLSAVIALYRNLKDFVSKAWGCKSVEGLTSYNRFIKLNIGAFDKSGTLADPLKLHVCDGDLRNPFNVSLVSKDESKIVLKWTNDQPDQYSRLNDSLCIICFNGESFTEKIKSSIQRKEQKAEIVYSENFIADAKYMYVFFENQDKTMYSTSIAFEL